MKCHANLVGSKLNVIDQWQLFSKSFRVGMELSQCNYTWRSVICILYERTVNKVQATHLPTKYRADTTFLDSWLIELVIGIIHHCHPFPHPFPPWKILNGRQSAGLFAIDFHFPDRNKCLYHSTNQSCWLKRRSSSLGKALVSSIDEDLSVTQMGQTGI